MEEFLFNIPLPENSFTLLDVQLSVGGASKTVEIPPVTIIDDITYKPSRLPNPIPEPPALTLLNVGLEALFWVRRRMSKKFDAQLNFQNYRS